jgi:hypothetical protein
VVATVEMVRHADNLNAYDAGFRRDPALVRGICEAILVFVSLVR